MYGQYTGLIREAVKLRYRMIPYLYSLMERAHETGLPIMEPMCSAFQQDAACYDEGVDFMVGDSLLVANVVEKGAGVRSVYLPEGERFYDYYTREVYEGGQTIEIPVTIESIPLFVRGGAVIPMAENQMKNLAAETATGITILCSADRDCEFTLYEDDGISRDYERGQYLKTRIALTGGVQTTLSFRQEGLYQTAVETMSIDFIHREKAPFWITLAGTQLPHYLHRRKYEEAESGWYYSQTKKSVQIKYRNPKEDYDLVISFEAFDMIGM